MEAILMWGISIVLALQALGSPALDGVFLAITQLNSEEFFLLLVSLVYWCLDKRFGVRLAFLFLFSSLGNEWLKAAFNSPRPYQYDSRVRLIGPPEGNPGFPSGHAQAATTIWVALGWRVRRSWLWAVAIVVVALLSLSRVYLGLHFPHDVLGGVVFGVVAVAIFVRVEPALSARLAALPFGAQVALAIVVPLVLLIVYVDRYSVAGTGVLAGLSAGYAVQRRWANFSVAGPTRQRALRFIFGAVSVLAIYLGLRIAFGAIAPEEDTALWFVLRFVRYGLVGLWTAGLWPMVAVRTGLAVRES